MLFIDLKKQQKIIKKQLDENLANVFSHGHYVRGAEIEKIEEQLCEYTGAKYAISCASGTDALQISLMALDLKPDDEIITTPFTFFATTEVIELLALKPVFIDIEPDTYNIDASKIETKITSKTKAIISVSLYGQCSDMDEIDHISGKYNLHIVEDAAQSFGASYKGRKSCNLSTLAATSFFPSKPLGCYGDGGMTFTSDETLANKLRCIANHGKDRQSYYTRVGINSRLDTLQAAVLLAKMSVFDDEIAKRKIVGERYTELLKNYVKTPFVKNDRTCVYAQYTIEVNRRDEFCINMKEMGIPTAIHYPIPLHLQPVLNHLGLSEGSLPVSENAAKRVVSLPMHPYLSESEQDFIIEKVKEYS